MILWLFFFLCHYSPGRISYILITTFLSQLPLFLLICQFLFSDVWYVWLSSLLATPFAIFHVCIFIIRNVSTLGSCGASPALLVWNQLMRHSLPATIATEVSIAKRCVNYYFVPRSFDLHDVQMSRGFFQPLEKNKISQFQPCKSYRALCKYFWYTLYFDCCILFNTGTYNATTYNRVHTWSFKLKSVVMFEERKLQIHTSLKIRERETNHPYQLLNQLMQHSIHDFILEKKAYKPCTSV